MAKITLSSIPSGYATAAAHNADNTAIEAAIENTLSRDGTGPNQMNANLDMNGYAILNQRATSGNENFVWKGTWVTGTTYAVNNLVYAPEGSNLGNTLICVTANTAGATLDGDAANWAVFAQRGAPGASGGDIVGPASSTADSLARFNGTTGKLLKDGAVIGTDVQAYSAKLASYTANTLTAANKIPYATALNTASELTLDTDTTLLANSDTSIPSQKAVKAYVDANSTGLGVGQTWKNVKTTPGRVLGTTYTNNTGKPIQVVIHTTNTGTSQAILIVDGVSIPGTSPGTSTPGFTMIVSAIVPALSTYVASSVNQTLNTWVELTT